MTAPEDRIFPLDVMRGAAILGILLMNVAAFALPRTLGEHPGLAGDGFIDRLIWFVEFILVDGKMRAILAMLFGASALLVIDRAEMGGRDGYAAQRRRLFALIAIGVFHAVLLWQGDILMLFGVAGLLALHFVSREPIDLIKWALGIFLLQLLVAAGFAILPWTRDAADYSDLLQRSLMHDMALHGGSYGALVQARLLALPGLAAHLAVHALPEVLAFMLLGMAMAKGGFFFAQWTEEQYAGTARRAYLVGVPPMIALGLWAALSNDPRVPDTLSHAVSLPLRIPIAIAHAALLATICARLGQRPLLDRLAAVGRLALSNYLLSSLILTSLFYGYGGNLYGQLTRAELLGVVVLLWAMMLLWSPNWIARFGVGPAERLWKAIRR